MLCGRTWPWLRSLLPFLPLPVGRLTLFVTSPSVFCQPLFSPQSAQANQTIKSPSFYKKWRYLTRSHKITIIFSKAGVFFCKILMSTNECLSVEHRDSDTVTGGGGWVGGGGGRKTSKCTGVILSLKGNSANWKRESQWDIIWGAWFASKEIPFMCASIFSSHRMLLL